MLFGFSDFREYLCSISKNLNTVFIHILIPLITFIDVFFSFFFHSPGAIYFLISMYCVDFVTGICKSINYTIKYRETQDEKYKSKILRSKKFPRFALTMLAALSILSMLKFMGQYSLIFLPLYSIFYPIFLGQQFISIAENLGEMNLIPYDIVEKIKKRINIDENK
jgi:hypothetical protein